jgi:hypothetical protein
MTARRLFWLALLVGCALRLLLVSLAMFAGPYDPYERRFGDPQIYVTLGLRLAQGEGYGPTAIKAPGYPVFLAAFFRVFGYHLHAIVMVQALVSALTAVFVFLAARALRPATAAWAFLIALAYYPFWFDAVYLVCETLLTCLTAAALWAMVAWRPAAAGALAALTILTKAVTWPFWVVVGLVRRGRLAYFVPFALLLAPWVWHTGGSVAPSYLGYQLIQLHNPGNRDFALFSRPGDLNEAYPGLLLATAHAVKRAPREPDPLKREYALNRTMMEDALAFIWAEPWQAIRAVGRSLQNMWRIDYPHGNWLRWVCNAVFYVGLLPFVVVGSWRAVREGPLGARLVVAFLVYFVAVHAMVASEIRYRISAMPAYFVLAALALPAVPRWLRPNQAES